MASGYNADGSGPQWRHTKATSLAEAMCGGEGGPGSPSALGPATLSPHASLATRRCGVGAEGARLLPHGVHRGCVTGVPLGGAHGEASTSAGFLPGERASSEAEGLRRLTLRPPV